MKWYDLSRSKFEINKSVLRQNLSYRIAPLTKSVFAGGEGGYFVGLHLHRRFGPIKLVFSLQKSLKTHRIWKEHPFRLLFQQLTTSFKKMLFLFVEVPVEEEKILKKFSKEKAKKIFRVFFLIVMDKLVTISNGFSISRWKWNKYPFDYRIWNGTLTEEDVCSFVRGCP